jgi:hypothetical protein
MEHCRLIGSLKLGHQTRTIGTVARISMSCLLDSVHCIGDTAISYLQALHLVVPGICYALPCR